MILFLRYIFNKNLIILRSEISEFKMEKESEGSFIEKEDKIISLEEE